MVASRRSEHSQAARELEQIRVAVDARWLEGGGIGRFAREVTKRLPFQKIYAQSSLDRFHPLEQFWLPIEYGSKNPDVLFTPGSNPPVLSPIPNIFVIHDLIPLRFSAEASIYKKIYYNTIVRMALKTSGLVLTVSEFSKNEILDTYNIESDKVVIVGNGVDNHFCPDGPSKDYEEPYILYIGNNRPHKNLESAIIAYAQSDIVNDIRFVISVSPDKNLSEIIQLYDIKNRVEFKGFISEEELPKYYRGAEALVHPSLYEGFGLTILEALSCGTPVAASNRTAIPEITDGAAVLFDPENINDISRSMERVVSKTDKINKIKERGIERSNDFSWDKVAERTKCAILSIVD